MSKSFINPIAQVSQQLNAVIMALAGATRIFELMDEEPEEDHGYVTLVNAKRENGELVECKERTGLWAWKHPHSDGTLTYEELKGDVVMEHVDFGYEENKLVLHDINLYAEPGQKVAFVGATGAGKTTITNLINRFYDIADGKIRYDGFCSRIDGGCCLIQNHNRRIIERGNHEKLIAEKGKYYQLYTGAFELE